MPAFVLDSSLALSWFMPDEPCDMALFNEVAEKGALVPSLWHLEISNVLLCAQRKGRLTAATRHKALYALAELPIIIDTMTSHHAWLETTDLAEFYGLTLYDACYLELAIRRSLPLITLDQALKYAATLAKRSYTA